MDVDFSRYSCQMALPGFNEGKQKKLLEAKVLIVGAGGLGCPVAQYLTATGVGTIGIADFDVVTTGNLHRQILYTPMDVGSKKATVACNRLQEQNPDINLIPHIGRITASNVIDILNRYDLVVDCTDNFETKYLLNDACVIARKPLVYGAIYQYDGQVAVWNMPNANGTMSPNYRDLFPEVDATGIPDCAEGGVIPSLAGMIGCMQANEVIKIVTNTGNVLAGKILILDALNLSSRVVKIGEETKVSINTLPETIHVPELSINDLKMCMRNQTVDLVDVRNHEEHNAFNIGGWHIPLSDIETNFSYFNSGKPVVFYCASGKRSADAVRSVLKKFPNVKIYSLTGGMKAWMESVKFA